MTLQLAGCIIRNPKGEILLIHRNTDKRRHWEIPGGKVEPGEKTDTTAIRELKEELGVDVKIEKILGGKEFLEDGWAMHYTWYQAEIIAGEPEIMEPQIFDEIKYFSISDLGSMRDKLSLNTQNFIDILGDSDE